MNSRGGEHPAEEELAHLLVVDDDSRIRALLARYLTMQGYRITTAASAADARTRMQSLAFDLLVLDVMMPGGNGLSLARDVRREGADVPIIFLTARGEIESRIEGLEAGGDDYLAKPFDPRELSLRIASLLRRSTQRDIVVPEERVVRFGQFQFDLVQRDLRRGDKRILLAEREREMLRLLAAARGNVVTRHALATCGTPCNGRSVDVQINRLRRKLEDDPAEPAYLITARGSGYRLALDG
ncbi:MAG: response regulator transcription factor [Methylobacteriaceae bacterium]|nr:response regulator transcription factor [Methylobacteriaceae bacterium]